MLKDSRLQRLLFFDIETRGQYPDYDTFREKDPIGADIWDKKAQRQYKDMSAAEAYEKRVSLYPEFGAITCLSYGVWKQTGMQINTISGENEKEVIDKIYILFEKASTNGLTPTGWNIKNFDIPWIVRKLLIYGKPIPSCISSFEKKPWEVDIFDMKEMWKSWCTIDCNFEEAVYSMGIDSPKDDIDGSMTQAVYWSGGIQRVAEYCEKDVKAMIQLAEKLVR